MIWPALYPELAPAGEPAVQDLDRVKGWGGRAIAVRLVLAALGQAAMVSGSSVIEFGVRNLSLHAALGRGTVACVLELLRDEDDLLIDLVSRRQLARADRYQLRIPDRYAVSVRWRRRRAGRIEAIHPAFLVLGGTAGLVYQALGQDEARGADVARTARLSASATSAAPCGCLLSTGSLSAARAGGAAVPSPWLMWPSRPVRPTSTASERRGTSRTGKAGGPGSGSTRARSECP